MRNKRNDYFLETLYDPTLLMYSEIVDDFEEVRKANSNRLKMLTRNEPDKDGKFRGGNYSTNSPEVERLEYYVEQLKMAEDRAIKDLEAQLRRNPLYKWAQDAKGVGAKQLARLLAIIGDPFVNGRLDQRRTVSALWAYSGLAVTEDGTAPKLRRGVQANWSTRAKTRAYLIAESCVKQLCAACREAKKDPGLDHNECDALAAPVESGSDVLDDHMSSDRQFTGVVEGCTCPKYRRVYDERRQHTAKTRPDWTPGHAHADAVRKVSKEVLKDLWRAARDWHMEKGDKYAAGCVREPGPTGE